MSDKQTATGWDDQLYMSAKKFVGQFFMMFKTAALYDPNNNAFINTLELLHKDLKELMERTGSLKMELVEGNLFLNEEKIKSDLYTFSAFSFIQEEFGGKKLGGLMFDSLPDANTLKNFMMILARFRPAENQDFQAFNALLERGGIRDMRALEFRKRSLSTVDEKTVSTNKASALRNYVRAVDMMKDAVSGIKEKRGFDVGKAKRVVYNLVKHSGDEGYSFVSLSTIKNYDVYTFHHCVNVCVIAIAFGQDLSLSRRQLADLGIAALYHDIGKVDIPKEILNKSSRFTDDEWRIMKLHPIMAIRHLVPLQGATDMDIKKAIPAFEHHRDYDLSGYPPLTIRKPLNFYSKVVAICDAYDAMTSIRVYQKGLLPSEAMQIIVKGAGKKFDPVLVKAFVNTMGLFPVGSLVELNSGDIGIVTEVNKRPQKSDLPKVMIIMNSAGSHVEPSMVDLAESDVSVRIVKALNPDQYKVNVAHYLLSS